MVRDYDSSQSSGSESEYGHTRSRPRRRGAARDPPSSRPQPGSAPGGNTAEDKKKKKKKKKLLPQESINKVWERFAQGKPNKALNVMPFAPVPAPAGSERANELLCAGYERAAEECRRKVRKIIQECRRVNMRYRDPGWDLDWDLKMEKGQCLNRLGYAKWDLSAASLLNPNSGAPKAVKRVHEIYEKPTFMKDVKSSDVKQGNLGDCWIIASLSGLANVKDGIKRICVEYDTKIGIYGFVFYRDGEWIYSIIDDKLYLKSPCWDSPSMQRNLLQQIDREDVERVYRKTYQTGSKALFFAQCKDQNETWVPLIEKAYAKAHGDYASLIGGWIGEGLEDLSGGVTTELLASDILDLEGFWEDELSKVNEEFLFGCSTGLLDGGYGDRDGITEGHAYIVMEARTLKDGTRLVKLRNPWGKTKKGTWEGAWSDGSKEWMTEVQEELGHSFGSDSVFWISYEDLLAKYLHFDRTRLFRDPDWRCCQRWIGIEVPWRPQYHEKFQFRLARESPLVLVLSQLDARYFKGLHGQYGFRLHFRLHERGRADAEYYVVRSHGNYLMDRSVSIELPAMPPGAYSVFISVAGERDPAAPSVEEVVRRECRKRCENEKFAQVGYAYDLAHSKAAAHLDEVATLRRRGDQHKASEARKMERRRMWEKRHTNRDIQRRQARKNEEKRKGREAAREAERAKAEEANPLRHKAVQTEEEKGEDKSVQTDVAVDADTRSESSSNSSGTPSYTPKSDSSASPSIDEEKKETIAVPPVDPNVSGAPPPPPPAQSQPSSDSVRRASGYSSEGESSASPVSDWEELYSSDDMSHKPRVAAPAPAAPDTSKEDESEDEKEPDPWNAVCIVGLRVYSKDEDLELRVVMEGDVPAEGGMGERGGVDLDDAQTNAGGEREKETFDEKRRDDRDYEVIKKDEFDSVEGPAEGCEKREGESAAKETKDDNDDGNGKNTNGYENEDEDDSRKVDDSVPESSK